MNKRSGLWDFIRKRFFLFFFCFCSSTLTHCISFLDTDGDDSDELYEVEKEIESSIDLETYVASSEFSVATTSIPHVFTIEAYKRISKQ